MERKDEEKKRKEKSDYRRFNQPVLDPSTLAGQMLIKHRNTVLDFDILYATENARLNKGRGSTLKCT